MTTPTHTDLSRDMGRMEAGLDALKEIVREGFKDTREEIAALRKEVKSLRAEQEADKADLAALKNKGTGLLIGVGLTGGTVGAALAKALSGLFGH